MKTNLTFRSWLPCLLAFVALSAVERPFSTAFAQGALTPPGPPGQTYRTLGQIEPRTPVTNSGALTISSSGSYYLTGNITVNSGDAITITCDNVTLDLNGFTISSTQNPATNGNAILLSGSIKNITILNGSIASGVINTGTYHGPGFGTGISGILSQNTLVSQVAVTGCLLDGIHLGYFSQTSVRDCRVTTVGNYGIYADLVSNCAAAGCGQSGIIGNVSVNNCYATSTDHDAISSNVVRDCYGDSFNATAILATVVENSLGNGHTGDGIVADVVLNCEGSSGSGIGIYSAVVSGCLGASNASTGVHATAAYFCWAFGVTAIDTCLAIGCVSTAGPINASCNKSLCYP